MAEQDQKKFNSELDKTSKLTEKINKSMKEGASIASAFQKSMKDVEKVMRSNVKLFKDMSSEAQSIVDSFGEVEGQIDKIKDGSKGVEASVGRVYKKAWKLPNAYKAQVGYADKTAGAIENQGFALKEAENLSKSYQRRMAEVRQNLQDMPEAAEKMIEKTREMQSSTNGLSQAVQRQLQTQREGKNSLIAQDNVILELSELAARKSGKTAEKYQDLADHASDVRDLLLQQGVQYDNIGSESFSTVDTEAKRLELLAEVDKINAGFWGSNMKINKALQEQVEAQLAGLDAIDEANVYYNKLNNVVKEGSDFITSPFEKLNGLLKALPFGGVASALVDIEGQTAKFKKATDDALRDFGDSIMDPAKSAEDMDAAFSNAFDTIINEGEKSIKKLVEGFGQVREVVSRAFGMFGGIMGSLLPIVAILAIAGKLAQVFFKGTMETRKEFGLTVGEAMSLQKVLNTTTMEFKLMGVSAEDVKAGAQGIMDNMGGVSQVTRENLTTMAQLNATLGLSGESAGTLVSQMMAVGASSVQAAGAQLESVGALAQAGGVAPAKVLEDVASNADKFAEFAKDGGENVFKAAIGARQLGVNMSTVAGAADALLDFESSINDQMEASMLTGKMINTDKARELALSGDLAGMQQEIVSQVGSQAEFERMNVIQRQAMAKAFGVSVQDLSKMVANQEKLNNMTDVQRERQDRIAGALQFLNTLFVKVVESFRPMLPVALGILSPFIALGVVLGGIVIGIGKLLELVGSLGLLGDAVLFAVGAFMSYRLVLKLSAMEIGKTNVQTMLSNKLSLKSVGLKLREIATSAIRFTQQKLGMNLARGGNALKLQTLALHAKNIAVKIKDILVDKASIAMTYAKTAALGILTLGTKLAAGATFLFNAALTANPIGLIVLGVIALVAGIALLVKKFGLMKVVGSILKVAFFPLFGIIGTFKLISNAIGGLKGMFEFFGKAVKAYLNIAFAPFFLAYKIFQKAKSFVSGFFGGGGDEGGTAEGEQKVTPESNAGKGGKVRQTVTSMTVRNGQVVESKSQTKEITMRLDKLNNTGKENVDASNKTAGQTRRLNSSISTG